MPHQSTGLTLNGTTEYGMPSGTHGDMWSAIAKRTAEGTASIEAKRKRERPQDWGSHPLVEDAQGQNAEGQVISSNESWQSSDERDASRSRDEVPQDSTLYTNPQEDSVALDRLLATFDDSVKKLMVQQIRIVHRLDIDENIHNPSDDDDFIRQAATAFLISNDTLQRMSDALQQMNEQVRELASHIQEPSASSSTWQGNVQLEQQQQTRAEILMCSLHKAILIYDPARAAS